MSGNFVMFGKNVDHWCEAVMNTHLAMGWRPCGKPATHIVTKGASDFAVCPEHLEQNRDLPSREIPAPAAPSEDQTQ